MVDARPPSLAPEGPPMFEAPPEREEGDWRSASVGLNISMFKDYSLAEKFLGLILLPIDR